jgi:hypothetical protein
LILETKIFEKAWILPIRKSTSLVMRKFLLLLFFYLVNPFLTFADDSGYGCMVGEHWVYTSEMGTSKVKGAGNEVYRYFSFTSHKIPIYPGYGMNLHRGYRCGYINRYPASSYYDSSIPPYGANVPIPAEQEYTLQGEPCVVSPTLGGPPTATSGQSGMGQYVYYTYNRTNMCGGGGPVQNVPLDDYIWLMLIGAGVVGYVTIVRKNQLSI